MNDLQRPGIAAMHALLERRRTIERKKHWTEAERLEWHGIGLEFEDAMPDVIEYVAQLEALARDFAARMGDYDLDTNTYRCLDCHQTSDFDWDAIRHESDCPFVRAKVMGLV